MTIELDEWRVRYLLEALRVCEAKWSAIAKGSEDEDVQADYSNDVLKLGVLYDGLEAEAVEVFGGGIKEFSRLAIAEMSPESLKAFYSQDGKVQSESKQLEASDAQ